MKLYFIAQIKYFLFNLEYFILEFLLAKKKMFLILLDSGEIRSIYQKIGIYIYIVKNILKIKFSNLKKKYCGQPSCHWPTGHTQSIDRASLGLGWPDLPALDHGLPSLAVGLGRPNLATPSLRKVFFYRFGLDYFNFFYFIIKPNQ